MFQNGFIFVIFSILSITVFCKNNYLNSLVDNQILSWCEFVPQGRIYSNEKEYDCHLLIGKSTSGLKIRNPLEKKRLRIGIIPNKEDYDYDCSGIFGNNGLKSKESYSHQILYLLKDILQFDVEFVSSNTWGDLNSSTGNWTGLVGLIKNNLSDLAICHTTVTKDRAEVVDFLFSTLHSRQALIYQPSRLPLTRDVFVLTFSGTLWLCFVTSLILLVICFRFSTWQHSRLRPDHEPWSWIEVMLWAVAAVCQQSYSRHPKGSSCRTMFLIGYLITYLLYTGFAAGVTSLLAVQGHDTDLGFSDVVIMKLKLILQRDGTHFEYLKNSRDPYAKSIYFNFMNFLQRHKVDKLDDMFSKLEHDNFIGMGSAVTLINYLRRKIDQKKSTEFSMSTIPHSRRLKGFFLQKNSPYKEIFNYWLLRLKEVGLLDIAKRKYVHIQERACCELPGWSSAGIGNVLSSVILLGAGFFFSVLILFFEMAWMQKSSSNTWEMRSKKEVLLQYAKNKKPKRTRY